MTRKFYDLLPKDGVSKKADNEIVVINGKHYRYEPFYNRLENIHGDTPAIICPKCNNDTFKIGYSDYECQAYCKCGHKMTLYEG